MQPRFREEVFDAYWQFAAYRHSIFEQRVRGLPAPWTHDHILQQYKFCNTFRAADRVTQYLLSEVIYGSDSDDLSPEDTFCRIVLFRLFSKPNTWEALEGIAGPVRLGNFDPDRFGQVLTDLRTRQAIYTSAFILAPPPDSGSSKHIHHLRLVYDMFTTGRMGRSLARAGSLKEVVELLLRWRTIGPFLAYQIAIDLNYSPYLAFSEDDFTLPGPGAVRGIRKVFVDTGDRSPQKLILDMVESQEDNFRRLELKFSGLFGRRLHAIDCQGLFCEVDKYSRVAFPELKSQRVRIKQEFRPTGPLPQLVFPTRWNLQARATEQNLEAEPPDSRLSLQLSTSARSTA